MSKLFFIFLFFFPSLLTLAQGYRIETIVHNSTDSVAYLGHLFADKRYVDDTAKIVNGKAVFDKKTPLIKGIYFYYTPSSYFEFIVEEQHFTMESKAPNFIESMKIHNSRINEGFYKLQNFTNKVKVKSKLLRENYDSAKNEEDKEIIKNKLHKLDKRVRDLQNELKKEHEGSFFATLITLMQPPTSPEIPEGIEDPKLFKYEYYRDNYWNDIDITDSGLLRTPLLVEKVDYYLDKILIQQPDSIIKAIDALLLIAEKNKESYKFLLVTLISKYESSTIIDFDKVFVHLIENYYLEGKADEWVNQELLNKLRHEAALMKPTFIGRTAPSLLLWDTLGIEVDLENIDSEYTVLYFYDPDCGHCKKTTPILYDAYPSLVEVGVEILAICTTTDGEKWKKYINKNDLGWINVADLEKKSYFKYAYNIRVTPTVFILDKNKKIVLKKIDALDIPDAIKQLQNIKLTQ